MTLHLDWTVEARPVGGTRRQGCANFDDIDQAAPKVAEEIRQVLGDRAGHRERDVRELPDWMTDHFDEMSAKYGGQWQHTITREFFYAAVTITSIPGAISTTPTGPPGL
ncbi:hypothetical protein [Streptomyces sviceus]|uniref:hypothetical protein n=1 Tax=Streptomyces sviceus TaxID=285530 RepID=UPI0036EABD48